MGDISKNFSFKEFEASNIAASEGIKNVITSEEVKHSIAELVSHVLQPLRDLLGAPLHINSGYRCKALNARVGGVATSQHCKGEAADISSPYFQPIDIARRIVAEQLPYDQLIIYPTFVHVSHKGKWSAKQRHQLLYNSKYTGEKI